MQTQVVPTDGGSQVIPINGSQVIPTNGSSNIMLSTTIEHIRKRDGVTLQTFDVTKIYKAVRAAWTSSNGPVDEKIITAVVKTVLNSLAGTTVDVETVQDAVEAALMRHGQFKVAKAYILYRHHRQELRQLRAKAIDPKGLSDYIHASKYARYLPELHRREVYEETVARVEGMHRRRFPEMASEIKEVFNFVREKKVLPSMRSMQFGGKAVLANNCRLFNCSFTHIDRYDAFSEALFLLLSGCGVGYSVQFDHVEKLPSVGYIDQKKVVHHVLEDSIEGWADALKALLKSYQDGINLEFSFYKIRPAGAPLKTSGGRAPGHLQLKESLERIRLILSAAQGRKLRPIECHKILCHSADAVLSGGIRRSAMICLFSFDDSEMMYAKTGNWYADNPWFANANNSVVLKRDEVKKKQFKRIFQMTRQWGEPGFYFTNDYDYGTNPCSEIGLYPVLTIDDSLKAELEEQGVSVKVGEKYSGWGFCNLCEINAAKLTSYEDFEAAAKAATLIGTLQATYTKMPYLGWVSEYITKRDALLGIGMTGMMDAPDISCNAEYQKKIAGKVKEWNTEYAARLGIRPAARTTCIKPSGTTSLELGCVGSGHHAHHARRYIRRVIADELEPVFQAFKLINSHMCVRKPDGKWVIEFPVEVSTKAIIKDDLSALKFLDMVKSTQQNWVLPGTADELVAPGLNHNVSNTITVRPDEWEAVLDYLWTNREFFTGVTLLSSSGDKDFAFAPNEAIVTSADEQRWNDILLRYKSVDYTSLIESEDGTHVSMEPACAGGICSLV
jgi:ribonucleoside-diphosphate reductase alpha chain